MKKPDVKILNLILALGMLLIASGFFMILSYAGTNPGLSFSFIPAVLLLLGMSNIFVYLAVKKQPFRLFAGIDLCLSGAFAFVILFFGLLPKLSELWPVFIIFVALSLFITGRTIGKRFSITYDLMGMIIFFIGCFFLLFSYDVIKISFSQMAVYTLPVLLILAGVFLIVLFRRRKAFLEILPEDISKELKSGGNSVDNEDESSGVF